MTAMAVAPASLDANSSQVLFHMRQRAEREAARLGRDPHLTCVTVEYPGAFNDPRLISEVASGLELQGWACSTEELPASQYFRRGGFLGQGHLARTVLTISRRS